MHVLFTLVCNYRPYSVFLAIYFLIKIYLPVYVTFGWYVPFEDKVGSIVRTMPPFTDIKVNANDSNYQLVGKFSPNFYHDAL